MLDPKAIRRAMMIAQSISQTAGKPSSDPVHSAPAVQHYAEGGEVSFDPKEGIGAVPYNQNIDYMGMVRHMPVSEFLNLARPLFDPSRENLDYLKKHIREGKPVGNPFFNAEWNEENKNWDIKGHEGRHRATAIKSLYGPNTIIPVHIFPRGGMRARDLTDEMKSAPFVSEQHVRNRAENENRRQLYKELGKPMPSWMLLPEKSAGGVVQHLAKGGKAAPVDYEGNLRRFMQGAHREMFDAQGKPRVFYHGTKHDIEDGAFRMERGMLGTGAYFTVDPIEAHEYATNATWNINPNIVPVHISMKNPFEVTDKWARVPKNLPELGYDGVLLRDKNGAVKWAVPIHQHQIKSAIGNDGTFDHPTDITKAKGGAVDYEGNLRRFMQGAHPEMFDAQGKPKVLYHGTSGNFGKFSPSKVGSKHLDLEEGPAYFFTDDPKTANWYARSSHKQTKGGGNVMPVHLSMKNPHVVNFQGEGLEYLPEEIRAARERGHDGLVAKNYNDGRISDHYIAFHPHQIKSAIGNDGTFDHPTDITKAEGGEVDEPRHLQTLRSRMQGPNIFKEKGDQWIGAGVHSPASAVQRLNFVDSEGHPLIGRNQPLAAEPHEMDQQIALNKWMNSTLRKYIERDMGTEHDPVRALAERGILHVSPEQLPFDYKQDHYQRTKLGKSDLAKAWEDATDSVVDTVYARGYDPTHSDLTKIIKENPWLTKVDPFTKIHSLSSVQPIGRILGFHHLNDELHNATRSDSDLPQHLRLKPESLQRVSVPQAVQLVHNINQWRKANAAEANRKKAFNSATHLHKDYPGTDYAWYRLDKSDQYTPATPHQTEKRWRVLGALPRDNFESEESAREFLNQISDMPNNPHLTDEAKEHFRKEFERHPLSVESYDSIIKRGDPAQDAALKEALKYEGDTMGHCVGGYTDRVLDGETGIYSLRNKKTGEPHVTIETSPVQEPNPFNEKPGIEQIKGKGNAKPVDRYLPYVQDFVKSGDWGEVKDRQNANMVDLQEVMRSPILQDAYNDNEPVWDQVAQHHIKSGRLPPRYVTKEEFDDPSRLLPQSKAYGGYIPRATGGPVLDPQQAIRKALMIAREHKADGGETEDKRHPVRIPQRLITSKRADYAAHPQDLNIDLAALRQSPELMEKIANKVRMYPNVPAGISASKNPERVTDHLINHMVENLLFLHDQVPDHIRQRSKLWYDGARNIVDHWAPHYGVPDFSVAAAIAALSPQKDWYQNVSAGKRVLDIHRGYGPEFYDEQPFDSKMEKAFKNRSSLAEYAPIVDMVRGKSLGHIGRMGLDPEEANAAKALWTRMYDEAYHDPSHPIISPEGHELGPVLTAKGKNAKIGWGSLGEIGKAISAIEYARYPQMISRLMGTAHKVRNFYNNILDPNSPNHDATIDTHAVAAALMRPFSAKSKEVLDAFGGAGGSSILGIRGSYPLYAEAYRRAAAQRGILPRQMQSITWEAVRGLFPDTFKTDKNQAAVNRIWRDYRQGRIDYNTARRNVYDYAGGIRPPSWHDERSGEVNAPGKDSRYTGKPAEVGVSGRSAGALEPGAGDGIAAAIPQKAYGGLTDGNEDARKKVAGVDGPSRAEAGEVPHRGGMGGSQGILPASFQASGPPAPLRGLPREVAVPISGQTVQAGPNLELRNLAESYMRGIGKKFNPTRIYTKADPARGKRVAEAFDAMKHEPDHPLVRAAYEQMARETMDQYRHAVKHGYKFEFWDPKTQDDPYEASPRLAVEDLNKNKHMFVFPTAAGFGSDDEMAQALKDNPLLAHSGEHWNGQPVTINDIFRAVHDLFGHAKEGVGFRADGEENAWRSHAAMYSPLARAAMTSETRGQNSWLNFGPHGEKNRKARTLDTHFADQKIGLLPAWAMHEGAEDFTLPEDRAELERLMAHHKKSGGLVDRALHLVSHLSRHHMR